MKIRSIKKNMFREIKIKKNSDDANKVTVKIIKAPLVDSRILRRIILDRGRAVLLG